MATIKAYTDTNQSKKLAEFLPPESADMWWREVSHGFYHIESEAPKGWYDVPPKGIPCWSLTALLNVLPISIDEGQHCLALINSNPNGDIEWLCGYEDYKGNLMTACYGDNQIDACMEMILKLKEYNLL